MRLHVDCKSVRLSVITFRYRDHIGWNSSKIISRPNSLRLVRSLTPIGRSGATLKISVEYGWGKEHKKAAKSPDRLSMWIVWTHYAADDFVKIWSNSDKN